MHLNKVNRRVLIKSAALGTIAVPLGAFTAKPENTAENEVSANFPSIDLAITKNVVLFSHFNLEGLKEIVDNRPELARSSYDWAFGDWESAIGAGSHVGRWDIIDYLINNGARPTVFTHIALGQVDIVKAILESNPDIKKTSGPHGISMIQHAIISARSKDRSDKHLKALQKLKIYLEEETGMFVPNYLETDVEDLKKYEGDYIYGEGEKDGLSIKINSRNMLSLGRLGTFGGGLFKIATDRFVYNGTPSTEVSFEMRGDESISMRVQAPNGFITARRK